MGWYHLGSVLLWESVNTEPLPSCSDNGELELRWVVQFGQCYEEIVQ
jgi:hypothetical protein